MANDEPTPFQRTMKIDEFWLDEAVPDKDKPLALHYLNREIEKINSAFEGDAEIKHYLDELRMHVEELKQAHSQQCVEAETSARSAASAVNRKLQRIIAARMAINSISDKAK